MASEVIGHELVKLRNICYLESLGSAVVVLNIILPSQVENFSVYFTTIAYPVPSTSFTSSVVRFVSGFVLESTRVALRSGPST